MLWLLSCCFLSIFCNIVDELSERKPLNLLGFY